MELNQPELQKKIEQMRKCRCCGKLLPASHFKHYAGGKMATICNNCKREKSGASEKFADFTTRELMDELKARGWQGKLRHVRVEEMTI